MDIDCSLQKQKRKYRVHRESPLWTYAFLVEACLDPLTFRAATLLVVFTFITHGGTVVVHFILLVARRLLCAGMMDNFGAHRCAGCRNSYSVQLRAHLCRLLRHGALAEDRSQLHTIKGS